MDVLLEKKIEAAEKDRQLAEARICTAKKSLGGAQGAFWRRSLRIAETDLARCNQELQELKSLKSRMERFSHPVDA